MCVELQNILEAGEKLQNEVWLWRNTEEIANNLLTNNITKEQHKNWLESLKKQDKIIAFIIHYKKQSVGCTFLKNIDRKLKKAEFGIFIKKDFWGKGIASKTLDLILEQCFQKLNLDEIYLEVLDNNTRAKNLYLKQGFIEDISFNKAIIKNNISIKLIKMYKKIERKI